MICTYFTTHSEAEQFLAKERKAGKSGYIVKIGNGYEVRTW